ncbi:SDR family NAD(P)-dependent oxidoreductase [Dechloromonas sp. HYN0024]|uniref:SDR family NAD(P)-dependent oxidoreductase n=1 Tax=Dechloromonas sp. HYN0024 TaxID=2231055 RepID=UPI000E43AADC|nr:SDR family oxidoreductase [Dechloromonas sp. HYN0024]AXS81139.1 SDR family oxidoreductase [Dechloromonas sp. HYN0024]
MKDISLSGKRVLITQADDFMGPALCKTFKAFGAEVLADRTPLIFPGNPSRVVADNGHIDAMVLNLAIPAPNTLAHQVESDEWAAVFAALVHPMQAMIKAVLPQMIERNSGKILLMGSAAALRGMSNRSSYAAARGAQLAYIQAVGVEVAAHKIQVNAIAQNFVENSTYFPPEVQAQPAFKERIKYQVPLGRLVSADEDSAFAAYLCSPAADCFVGQVFPVCGGWVTR